MAWRFQLRGEGAGGADRGEECDRVGPAGEGGRDCDPDEAGARAGRGGAEVAGAAEAQGEGDLPEPARTTAARTGNA